MMDRLVKQFDKFAIFMEKVDQTGSLFEGCEINEFYNDNDLSMVGVLSTSEDAEVHGISLNRKGKSTVNSGGSNVVDFYSYSENRYVIDSDFYDVFD
jgi:hypothetical protein